MSPLPGARGAIVFAVRAEQPFARDAVWLFTRVDFTPGPDGGLVWLSPARNHPAAFLHLGGCFWIVNAGLSANGVQPAIVHSRQAKRLRLGRTLCFGSERGSSASKSDEQVCTLTNVRRHRGRCAVCSDEGIRKKDRTISQLQKVEGKARVEEIARMLGGKTDSALAHAKALLGGK